MTTALNCELVTAIVTPFTQQGEVDYPGLERLIHHLVQNGSDGILVCGTTGEHPTLGHEEKLQIVDTAKQALEGTDVKLIANVGTNNTEESIAMAQEVAQKGVDGLLVVVPYYNKPSQKGMMAHIGAVAQAVPDTPVIIYNIPGRCVVNMLPDTMATLASTHANIVGVKQSNGDMDQVSDIMRLSPEGFRVWSGDDSLTLSMVSLGATGCVSVASHVTGPLLRDLIQSVKSGQLERAQQLQSQQMAVFKELFFLPNPVVVKTCLARLGLIEGHVRLPMVAPDAEESQRIDALVSRIQELMPQLTH